MAADNRDDDTDLTDPELADFTAAMEGTEQTDEEIVAVAPDRAKIRQLQQLIGLSIHGDAVAALQPLYMEMLIALGNLWLNVAETCLAECDVDIFHLTRGELLAIIGIMSARVNEMPPSPTALANADTTGIVH